MKNNYTPEKFHLSQRLWFVTINGNILSFLYLKSNVGIRPPTSAQTAKSVLQSAVCSLRSAVCSLRSAVCSLRSAVCSLRSAVCGLQSAVCGLQSAVCSLRSAVCSLRFHPTADEPGSTLSGDRNFFFFFFVFFFNLTT